MSKSRASFIALAAILIALTTVFTLVIRVPITATGGYLNFSDAVIYFASFTFGPWIGLIAGGIGTGLADLLGGFAAFAPLSLLAHGLEGLAVGLIAGGIGAGLADLLRGFAAFSPILSFPPLASRIESLMARLEARTAGTIVQKRTPLRLALGWLAGTIVMVGIYFLGEGLFYGIGWGAALAEVPWNLLQNLVGGLVGIPLFYAVRKAYPPITRMGQPSEWREG